MSDKIKTGLMLGARILVFFLALAASFLILAAGKKAFASSVYLKNSAILTENVIRLGDIFGGLDTGADKVLGPAPHPGKNITLGARTLLRVALALDLPWRPTSEQEQIVIKRAATVIDDAVLKEVIARRISEENLVSGQFDVQFATTANEIVISHELPPEAEVVSFKFSPRNNWFEAIVAAPSASNPASQRQLTGTIKRVVEVPVLKDNIRNGEIIRASDLETVKFFEGEIQHDYLLKTDDLIGMTPRRMVMAGKPVRNIDLEAPKLVERGDKVVIVFEEGTLRLTAEGRALRAGAKGDYIKVVNRNSSRTVEGVIIGERMITVR